jgi:hypothetical protein
MRSHAVSSSLLLVYHLVRRDAQLDERRYEPLGREQMHRMGQEYCDSATAWCGTS